jgi:hypothetical protein
LFETGTLMRSVAPPLLAPPELDDEPPRPLFPPVLEVGGAPPVSVATSPNPPLDSSTPANPPLDGSILGTPPDPTAPKPPEACSYGCCAGPAS